jgi:hypothetical protein
MCDGIGSITNSHKSPRQWDDDARKRCAEPLQHMGGRAVRPSSRDRRGKPEMVVKFADALSQYQPQDARDEPE